MDRYRIPDIVLGILLATAFFVVLELFGKSTNPLEWFDEPFTPVLAISTVALWWSTRNLALTTRRQADEMKEALRISERAATATQQSAEAMERTVELAEENSVRQLRAYVSASITATGTVAPGKKIRITLTLSNSGQTPAYNTVKTLHCIVDSDEPHNDRQLAVDGPLRATSIGPGEETYVRITRTLSQSLFDRSEKMFAFGHIKYSDVFKVERTTKFKTQLSVKPVSKGKFLLCSTGNESD